MDDRATAHLTLIFDGTCGPCTRAAEWIRARDRRGVIRLTPCQQDQSVGALGVTRTDCEKQVVAVDDGNIFRGAAAINRVLSELGSPWSTVGRVLSFPPLLAIESVAYRSVAANRRRLTFLGVQPECDKPHVHCD